MKKPMSYRNLGKSGLKVSTFSLGGWTTFGGSIKDESRIREILTSAFEAGINFFDNADIYAKGECEIMMGKALKNFRRRDLVLSSKVFWPMSENINDKGLSRKHIMESCHDSLRRFGLDYLDIYFCHRFDPDTPLEETCEVMNDLVRQGKILYWGTSEWTGAQLQSAHLLCRDRGWTPPSVEQPQYSLLVRDRFESDVAPMARDLGMGLVVWSPLASGFLSGKYDDGIREGRLSQMDWVRDLFFTDKNRERVKQMKSLADQMGCTRSQLALAWAAQHRAVSSVILGATQTRQLQENLGALDVEISDDLKFELNRLFSPSSNN